MASRACLCALLLFACLKAASAQPAAAAPNAAPPASGEAGATARPPEPATAPPAQRPPPLPPLAAPEAGTGGTTESSSPAGARLLRQACTAIAAGNPLPAMDLFRSEVLQVARSVNLDDTGARRLLDGVVQDFRIPGRQINKAQTSVHVLFADATQIDRPRPPGALPWSALTGQDHARERQREIERLSLVAMRPFRILDPSATLTADEAVRQGSTVQARPPRLAFRDGRVRETSMLILGCDAAGVRDFAASANFEMSNRSMVATTTLVLLLGIWIFMVTVAPGSREARALAREIAARAREPAFRGQRDRLLRDARVLRVRSWLDPVVVTQDQLGYGSVARLQIVFFTFVVFAALAYILQRAGVLQEISEHILYLLGIAGAGSALSSVVSANRAANRPGPTREGLAWLGRAGILPERLRVGAWQDLIVSDREVDPYRLQILVFSGLVGGFLLLAGANELAALRIPDNLMALLGLSQVVYVGGKALNPPADWTEANAAVAAADLAEKRLREAVAGRLRAKDPARFAGRGWTGAFSLDELEAEGGEELKDFQAAAEEAAAKVRPLLASWSPFALHSLPPLSA